MKSVRTILLASLVFSVVIMAVVAFFVTKTEGFDPGMLIAMAVSLIIMGVVIIPILRSLSPGEIKNGISAKGTVLKVWDTGVSINDNPQVGLLVEITPKDLAPYEAEVKTVISRLNVGILQEGTLVEVVYDPLKPERVTLKTIFRPEEEKTSAAERLQVLDDLRLKHLISEREYEEKRSEIIKAI